MMRAVPIRMSSFGKRSGIDGYSNELTKALAPHSGGPHEQHSADACPDLSAVKLILSAATAGEARAKLAATMSGVRTRRPGL